MKKVFLTLAMAGLVFSVSCNNKDKSETTTNETATEETTNTAEIKAPMVENAEISVSEIPQFSNPEVQEFAHEYAAYIEEVLKATANKDVQKVAELQSHSVEWSQKGVSYAQKMTQEERQNWDVWNKKMAEKVQNQGQ